MIIGVLPDIHEPYSHDKALSHAKEYFKDCDKIISLGDMEDFHAFSKYGLDPDAPSPGSELELCIKGLRKWQKAFPEMEIVGSNHNRRVFTRAVVGGLPRMVLKRMRDILHYPEGWVFHEDGIVIDGIYFFHGEGLNGHSWNRAHEKYRMSCVFGHIHSRAGIQWSWTKTSNHGITKKMFSFNVGCLVDPSSDAFNYSRHSAEKPVLGVGKIVHGIPHFYPLI